MTLFSRFAGISLLFASMVFLCIENSLAQQRIEDYSARPLGYVTEVSEGPVIDGDLSDSVYTQAQPLKGFNSRFLRRPPSQQTQARLVWTAEGMYAGIQCMEDSMDEVISIATERDGAVQGDNSITLTLTPGDRLSDYYEFAVNTLGTMSDEYAGNKDWDAEWKAAVGSFDGGWTAELFIPWSALDRSPSAGDAWGLGIARVEGPHAEYSNWAIVNGDYEQRTDHGQVVFTNRNRLSGLDIECPEQLLMGHNRISGGLLRGGSQGGTYTVRFQRWEHSDDAPPREVDLVENEVSAEAPSFVFETTIDKPGTYLLSFSLSDGPNTVYRSTFGYRVHPVEGERFALEPKQPTYTWEDEARFYLSVNPSVGTLDQMQVLTEVFTTTGRIVQKQEDPLVAPHQVIRLPLANLIDGTYYADLSLLGPRGLITSWTITFDKQTSDPPPAVSTLPNGTILIGDTPFLPLGMFEVPDIAEISEAGFNVVLGREAPDFTREQEMTFYLDRCQELGLRAVLTVGSYVLPELERSKLREAVCRVKDHPALLGYLLLQRPSESGIEPDYLDTVRTIIRDVDPFHPTLITEETQVMFPGYADASDIFVPTWFPVPFASLTATGNVMKRACEAKNEDGSVLMCLQAFGRAEVDRRHPTLKESRVMAWMALIHEADGLLWWSCEETKRSGHWGDIKQIANDIETLRPFILNGNASEIAVSNTSPAVFMRTWRLGEETLVLVANAEAKAGGITLPGEWDSARSVLGDRPSIEPGQNGAPARLPLEPYGVEALILRTGRP